MAAGRPPPGGRVSRMNDMDFSVDLPSPSRRRRLLLCGAALLGAASCRAGGPLGAYMPLLGMFLAAWPLWPALLAAILLLDDA